MSIASSVARSVATPVARAVAGLGGGGSVWTPAALSNLRQWLASNYYSAPVGGLQVIESLETHGTVRAPQPGCCALFDGVNDYGATAATNLIYPSMTVMVRIKGRVTGGLVTKGFNTQWALFIEGNWLIWRIGGASLSVPVTSVPDDGTWNHISATSDGTLAAIFVNGVKVGETSLAEMPTDNSTPVKIGVFDTVYYNPNPMCDVRIYSVAKTAPEVAAIAACDFTNLDKTGIVAHWYLNNRAGTVAYDASGNGNDLTLNGPITEATFWAEDSAITANPANVLGYTLSGSTIIPRDESDITKDVQGNALQYTGLSPYPVTIDTPCVTLDGVNDYINLGDVSTSPTTISLVVKLASDDQEIMTLQNSTATAVTVVAGVLTFGGSLTVSAISVDGSVVSAAAAGALLNDNGWHTLSLTLTAISCSALRIGTDGSGFGNVSICELELTASGATKTFPFQEGPGTAVDNVKVYWYKTDGTYGSVASALVGVTVAAAWANRCPGYVRDHAFEYGGRLDTLGAFCPLVPGTSLCADGNAATIAAGTIPGSGGNPYSRVDFDPFDAAELGALAVPAEFDSLPCVTGNGSDVYVDLGAPLIPATSDFQVNFWLYSGTASGNLQYPVAQYVGGTLWGFYLNFGFANLYVIDGACGDIAINDNTWYAVQLSRVGNLHSVTINGTTTSRTKAGSIDQTGNTYLLNRNDFATPCGGRISNVLITAGGSTKHFPLTDGSGDDIAMYENGVATIIPNAIQGTLTNVWSNKTEGKVDHEFPEATRAIVPRDTKFTNGSTKTITTSEPATGADLDNILGYIG